jgi:GntR family transcriptional regulator, galactonate operon transcriptional repressor
MTDLSSVAGLLEQGRVGVPGAPKKPQRLATPVIADFVDQIVGGNFPPGTDLPSEGNICKYLGISRTVLREVLKVLEQKGLVRVENGKGTRINERDEWKLLDPVVLSARLKYDENRNFINHLVRVRATLESDLAAEAAREATPEHIALMAIKIEELRSNVRNHDRYFQIDRQFHETFMRASGNELGRAIVINMYTEAQSDLEGGLEDTELESSLHGHIEIYEAIAARDSERASRAVLEHINGGWAARTAHSDAYTSHHAPSER